MADTAANYQSAHASIGFGEESTYLTTVARSNWRHIIGCSFQHRYDLKTREHTRTNANSFNRFGGFYNGRRWWDGRLSLEASYDAIGMLLKHAIGSVSTQNDTPSSGYYTHTYVRSITFPTGLSFELNRGGTGSSPKELFAGGKVRQWELSGSAGGYMRLDLDCMGGFAAAETEPRSNTVASATIGTDDNLIEMAQGSTVGWNSTTLNVKRFRTSVDNGLFDAADRQFIGNLTNLELIRNAPENILFEADCEVSDPKFVEYLAMTQGDLTFNSTLGTRAFNQTIQNAQLESYSDPLPDSQFGVIMQTLRWRGWNDGTDAGYKLVVVNQESSATGNG